MVEKFLTDAIKFPTAIPTVVSEFFTKTRSRLNLDCPGKVGSDLTKCRVERVLLLALFTAAVFYLLSTTFQIASTFVKAALTIAIAYFAWTRLA